MPHGLREGYRMLQDETVRAAPLPCFAALTTASVIGLASLLQ
jgi:hypothetical protein